VQNLRDLPGSRDEFGRMGAALPSGGSTDVTTPELHACSACAGDYEDPERTAWVADELAEAGDEEDTANAGDADEFPDSGE